MKSTGSDNGADFEDWLRREFSQTLGPERGPRPRPASARYSAASRTGGTRFKAFRSTILASLSAKAVAGGAVAALAAGGATAAIAATGSVNPATWGQHVVQAVRGCKDEGRAADGTNTGSTPGGIGQCVSAVARQHGEQQRAGHAAKGGESTPASPTSSPGKHDGNKQNTQSAASVGASAQGGAHGKAQGNAVGIAHGNGNQGHGKPTPTPTP